VRSGYRASPQRRFQNRDLYASEWRTCAGKNSTDNLGLNVPINRIQLTATWQGSKAIYYELCGYDINSNCVPNGGVWRYYYVLGE
jgi:hypothetical protein